MGVLEFATHGGFLTTDGNFIVAKVVFPYHYSMKHIETIRPISPILAAVLFLAAASPVSWAQTNSRDQLRWQDLNYVSTQLPKLHVNFFFQLNPQDFNQAVQAVDAQIPFLTDTEFNVRLAALAAMAGDPHTMIFPAGGRRSHPEVPPRIPLAG